MTSPRQAPWSGSLSAAPSCRPGFTHQVQMHRAARQPARGVVGPASGQARSELAAQERVHPALLRTLRSGSRTTRRGLGRRELHPHQVGVARRVLADPVQRYLLATRSASARRSRPASSSASGSSTPRIDRTRAHPERARLAVGGRTRGRSSAQRVPTRRRRVDTYEDPRAFDQAQVPDLLVIDEAHRVAAGRRLPVARSGRPYEAAALAHRIPRVLLLSSAPGALPRARLPRDATPARPGHVSLTSIR